MSIKYGRIDYSETGFTEQDFHKNQTLKSSSLGVHHHFAKKDDYTDSELANLTTSGSHWAFVHGMFYLSGSSKINADEVDKFNNIYQGSPDGYFSGYKDLKPFFQNKFYDTASVFYIPQQYFGQRVQTGSFTLTARTGSYSNTTKQIIIKDDGNGNLYSTNAAHSQSANSLGITGSVSSSVNYVGNIWYELGIAVLTETASWSGSVNYTDIGGKESSAGTAEQDYRYWQMVFNSTTPIFTSQYSIKIPAGKFNHTLNFSARGEYDTTDAGSLGNINPQLTVSSSFSPYFNQIQLFRNNNGEEPLLIANLPRNIRMRDDIDLIITFRVDH